MVWSRQTPPEAVVVGHNHQKQLLPARLIRCVRSFCTRLDLVKSGISNLLLYELTMMTTFPSDLARTPDVHSHSMNESKLSKHACGSLT